MSGREFDRIDAAYILANLLEYKHEHGIDSVAGGELEVMSCLWDSAVHAAQAITAHVHPDEYTRLAVFCYEVLDGDVLLTRALVDKVVMGRVDYATIEDTVVLWLHRMGIKRN